MSELWQRLGFDGEFEYEKCMRCDYLNNDIPISQKKTKCIKSENTALSCPPYLLTVRLKERIALEKGITSIMFFRDYELFKGQFE